MMSKKEIGMIVLAGAGIIGITHFLGDGAPGGGGAERAGKILGSPGTMAGIMPSAGTGSSKQIAAVTGYMPPGAKTKVTPEMRHEYQAGFVPSKTAYSGKQVSPTYIPEAASQAYIAQSGGVYVAPTFNGVGGKIIGGRYTPPTGLYPSKTQAGLTAKGLATQKKVASRSTGRAPSRTQAGLTSKGLATQKKAAARKKTPSSGYAAALARSG